MREDAGSAGTGGLEVRSTLECLAVKWLFGVGDAAFGKISAKRGYGTGGKTVCTHHQPAC